jgi:hypothetical protein
MQTHPTDPAEVLDHCQRRVAALAPVSGEDDVAPLQQILTDSAALAARNQQTCAWLGIKEKERERCHRMQ